MPDDEKKDDDDEDEEQQPDEDIQFIGKAPKKKSTRITFYHPPLPFPTKKFDPEDKRDQELLRQFRVNISNIEITNQTKELLDPFVRFIIGGTFHIEKKKLGKEEIVDVPIGRLGIVHTTGQIPILQGGQSQIFERKIITVYTASYFMLEAERLHVQVWDSEGFYLNKFMSYNSIPLIDIVDGPMQQSIDCYPYIENFQPGKLNVSVSMKVNLAEIWDFHLEFLDWKTTSLQNQDDKKQVINPILEIYMDSPQALYPEVKSEVLNENYTPYWEKLKNSGGKQEITGLLFRGTYHELKSQEIIITLRNKLSVGSSVLGTKIIPLRDVIDINFAKTDMIIHKTKATNAQESDDDFDKLEQVCSVQGSIIFGSSPKWRQKGEDELLEMRNRYFCVKINQANVFGDLRDGGDPKVWCEVRWAGMSKNTRQFKKENVFQILYFKIPIPPEKRKSPPDLEQYFIEELQTKTEFQVIVWADTNKLTIENIGSGKMCLSHIASNKVKYEDHEFTDPVTREKYPYQARVYTENVTLLSSFWQNAKNQVNCSIWFQEDLPFPGVDLSKLKPKTSDSYPLEIAPFIHDKQYLKKFNQVIQVNFEDIPDYPTEERYFEIIEKIDQYTDSHLLPLYLSKITNPDQSKIEFDDNEYPIRGIRTFAEIAHYVRCIPYQSRDNLGETSIWTSPDFTIQIKIGTEDDHALLMASIFRTCQHEDLSEFTEFANEERKKTVTKKDKDKKLLAVTDDKTPAQQTATPAVEDAEETTTGDPNTPPNPQAQPNATSPDPAATKPAVSPGTAPSANAEPEKKTEKKKEGANTIDDRVFVCLGKPIDGSTKMHIWVMTISRNFETVIFWDPKQHKNYVLKGRIKQDQKEFLEAYLSPTIDAEEKKQIDKIREEQKSLRESMISQEMEKYDGTKKPFFDDEPEDDDASEKEKTDEEKLSDSIFERDVLVEFQDIDQIFKGENINNIGQIDGLGKQKKEILKTLDYNDDADPNAKKEKNRFFQEQEKDRKRKQAIQKDIHLLPVEKFFDHNNGNLEVKDDFGKLPYPQIDLIFNHKNVFANLQNPNPQKIYYHIHDKTQWLPLVNDVHEIHPKVQEKIDLDNGIEKQPPKDLEGEKKGKKKKKKVDPNEEIEKKKKKIFEYKFNGDYMKPFTSYYDIQGMGPPLTEKQIIKIESKIHKEVENAIRIVRSSKNMNANLHNTQMVRLIMKKYIDYLEDLECQRLSDPKITREKVNQQLRKLVPENFKISMMPAFFNHIDPERIGTVIRDSSRVFLLDAPKKVKFSVAVKIFPYNSQINSVRVVLVRFQPAAEGAGMGDDEENEGDTKSKKSKSKKSSRSQKSSKSKEKNQQPQDDPQKK